MAHLLVPIRNASIHRVAVLSQGTILAGFNATPHLDTRTASMPGRSTEAQTMTHLWVRAEERPHEARVGLTPEGAAELIATGIAVTVEDSPTRAIPIDGYRAAGADHRRTRVMAAPPRDTIVFGLKELAEDGTPLIHRHIMFGHAYKGQPAGRVLLRPVPQGRRNALRSGIPRPMGPAVASRPSGIGRAMRALHSRSWPGLRSRRTRSLGPLPRSLTRRPCATGS
jgi:hypothetical protein